MRHNRDKGPTTLKRNRNRRLAPQVQRSIMKTGRVLGRSRCDTFSQCPAILEFPDNKLVVIGSKVSQLRELDVRKLTEIADHEAAVVLSRQTLANAVAD